MSRLWKPESLHLVMQRSRWRVPGSTLGSQISKWTNEPFLGSTESSQHNSYGNSQRHIWASTCTSMQVYTDIRTNKHMCTHSPHMPKQSQTREKSLYFKSSLCHYHSTYKIQGRKFFPCLEKGRKPAISVLPFDWGLRTGASTSHISWGHRSGKPWFSATSSSTNLCPLFWNTKVFVFINDM